MDLARIRSLVIWAALSLSLLSVVYAPKQLLIWSEESHAWVIPKNLEFEHMRERGFIWITRAGTYGYSIGKYVTDWQRMTGELILIVGIGVGLVFALRDKPKA